MALMVDHQKNPTNMLIIRQPSGALAIQRWDSRIPYRICLPVVRGQQERGNAHSPCEEDREDSESEFTNSKIFLFATLNGCFIWCFVRYLIRCFIANVLWTHCRVRFSRYYRTVNFMSWNKPPVCLKSSMQTRLYDATYHVCWLTQ